VAEPLNAPDLLGATSQHTGFGTLPKLELPQGKTTGQFAVNTELPQMQSTVTVLRLPPSNLNLTEFQNLSQAIGLPAGLIGNQTQNLGYALTWTNQENFLWKYYSYSRQLTFTNDKAKPDQPTTSNWLGRQRLVDTVDAFLKLHGIDEKMMKNIQILPAWKTWLDQLEADDCLPSQVSKKIADQINNNLLFVSAPPALPATRVPNCSLSYPGVLPITFERLVDGWNILDKLGQPEMGGQLLINTATGELISGWITWPVSPERSDYPALSTNDMQKLLEQGGLLGPLPGDKTVTATSYAFVRLPKANDFDYEYLVPALVAEAVRSSDQGPKPYRIVVPLIQQ